MEKNLENAYQRQVKALCLEMLSQYHPYKGPIGKKGFVVFVEIEGELRKLVL